MARQIESKTVFSAIDKISPVTDKIAKSFIPLNKRLESVGRSLTDFGSSTMMKGTVGLGGIFLGAVKPAMEFEKAMANVYKTFDPKKIGISEKGFAKTVRNMSSNMGIMATQMASIFENMPLPEILNLENVSATDKYKGIIDMAKITAMSVTTMGLEASDAGDKIKSMFNVLGGKDINKVIQTMNAVNEMGNQFGVKPTETLEFLTRQGGLGLGATAKLTNLETSAVGGTMLGFGATPETAKTSFQKMINVGQAYTSATPKQVEAFKKLGTSAKQFAEYWQKSPTTAIIDILNRARGLKDIEVTPVFKELFGVEGSTNIKTLMLNTEKFTKMLALVNDEQAINNSVLNEFTKLSKTSSFAVDKMKSSLNNIGIVLGDLLLPYVTKIADKITEWTQKYEKLSPETKKMIGDMLILTTGTLAFGLAIGGVSYALGGLAVAMRGVHRLGSLTGLLGGGGGLLKGSKNIKDIADTMKTANNNRTLAQKMPSMIKGNNLGVSFMSDFDAKPANQAKKLGFFTKFKDIITPLGGLLAGVGLSSKNLFSVLSFGSKIITRIALPIAVISGLGEAIYKNWDKLTFMFDKIGISLNVLADAFGLGGAGGRIKEGAMAISSFISDIIGGALIGILEMTDRVIRGLSFSGNLIKTRSWSKAGELTDAAYAKYAMTEEQRKQEEQQKKISQMPTGIKDFDNFVKKINNAPPTVNVYVSGDTKTTEVMQGGKLIKRTKEKINTGKTSPVVNAFPLAM